MATGVFTISPTTAIGKGSQFPAVITKAEIRSSGENASQFVDLGPLGSGELEIKSGVVMAQGKQPIAVQGYEVKWKYEVLSAGTVVRAALDLINAYGTDTRLTTKGGDVFTFLYTDGCDCWPTETSTATDINKARSITIEGGGSISKAVYGTCYTQHT